MVLILLALAVPFAGGTAWLMISNHRDQIREIERDGQWRAMWHERIYEDSDGRA